ncbi:unnamed protein product [Clavelina lepadiformis]|uniref:Protein phosphatase 1 regulatory subunit 21 n=1 Tax=Clavelina lepadiformis TaxID=159417 RepID=A0ABP0GVP8_CLALP
MTDINVKYQRLAQEYAKLKAQNQVLKKAVVDAKETTGKLQIDLQNKEQVIRRSQQEIDSSDFRSQQMARRIELLQVELEQKSHAKKSKSASDRPNLDGFNAKDEDLQNKIQENEVLHKKVYEYDAKKKQLEESLNDRITAAKKEAQSYSNALQDLQEQHDKMLQQFKQEKANLEEKVLNMEASTKQSESEAQAKIQDLLSINFELKSKVEKLTQTVSGAVVFNDCENGDYNNIQIQAYNKRSQAQTEEIITQAKDLIKEFCNSLKSFHKHTKERCLLYPVDSQFESPSDCNIMLSQHLDQSEEVLQSIVSSFEDAFADVSFPISMYSTIKLDKFTESIQKYMSHLSKIQPHKLSSLKEECDLSLCAPLLQSKNSEYLCNYERLLPAMSKLCTYLSYITSSRSDDSKENEDFAYQKIVSAVNELHLMFKDLSKVFNGKMVLEYQLPTTSKSPKLRQTNEFLLASMLSLATLTARLSGFIHANMDFFIQNPPSSKNSAMNVVNITHRVSSYMDRVSLSSPPVSIPYLDALHRKNDVQVENREELFNRLQKNANQLQTLEQEKEHWILETQLLQMKLEKQKQQNTNQDKTVERHRTLSVSLAPLDSSMLGSLDTPAAKVETTAQSTEDMIKQHMTNRLTESGLKTQTAEGKALHYENECQVLHKHFATMQKKKQSIHDALDKSTQRVSQLQDELSVTRRSYEEQLSLMSEHLAAMNDKLASQKDEIDTLKVKVTCVLYFFCNI